MSTFIPAISIDEVIDRLNQIIETSNVNNSREGYFAALYKRVTVSVKNNIEAGNFQDNPRMETLDVIFANRYLEAYHEFHHNEACSESWQVAFKLCRSWRPLVIQHLFVGMNAHISLDLGIAAAEVQPENLDSLHADFNKINEVLGALVNQVQDELSQVFPLLKPIDWLAGGTDEKIAEFAMGIARDAAWEVAKTYASLPPNQRAAYVTKRDADVAKFGREIASPSPWITTVIATLRFLEIGTVRSKIETLNEPSIGSVPVPEV